MYKRQEYECKKCRWPARARINSVQNQGGRIDCRCWNKTEWALFDAVKAAFPQYKVKRQWWFDKKKGHPKFDVVIMKLWLAIELDGNVLLDTSKERGVGNYLGHFDPHCDNGTAMRDVQKEIRAATKGWDVLRLLQTEVVKPKTQGECHAWIVDKVREREAKRKEQKKRKGEFFLGTVQTLGELYEQPVYAAPRRYLSALREKHDPRTVLYQGIVKKDGGYCYKFSVQEEERLFPCPPGLILPPSSK